MLSFHYCYYRHDLILFFVLSNFSPLPFFPDCTVLFSAKMLPSLNVRTKERNAIGISKLENAGPFEFIIQAAYRFKIYTGTKGEVVILHLMHFYLFSANELKKILFFFVQISATLRAVHKIGKSGTQTSLPDLLIFF